MRTLHFLQTGGMVARTPFLKTVRRAIREASVLRLQYKDAEGSPSDRKVNPLAIWAFSECWLFAGWCHHRSDFCAFRIDRISAIEDTGDRFDDHPGQNLPAYLATRIFIEENRRLTPIPIIRSMKARQAPSRGVARIGMTRS